MLGLGEEREELLAVMREVRDVGCSILTLGQYLQPSKTHLTVEKYYHPDEFAGLRDQALALGFRHVVSSYHAEKYGTASHGQSINLS
jgi:lipoic acid synthetase